MRSSRFIVFGLCSMAAGCVDPGAEFDAFAGRSSRPHSDGGPPEGDAAPCTLRPGDVTGSYLLALSVTIAPTKPIVALADVTTPALGGGVGIALDAQPLSAADRRTPVGQKLSLGPFQVDSSGGFRAELTNLEVTGAANPITGGDITANAVLTGSLCGAGDFFCGTVTGQVQKPLTLDLGGSTFTLTRVDPSTDPPSRPRIDCSGALADPL